MEYLRLKMKKTEMVSFYSALNPKFAQILRSGAHFHKDKNKPEESEKLFRICSDEWKTIDDLGMTMKNTHVLSPY